MHYNFLSGFFFFFFEEDKSREEGNIIKNIKNKEYVRQEFGLPATTSTEVYQAKKGETEGARLNPHMMETMGDLGTSRA